MLQMQIRLPYHLVEMMRKEKFQYSTPYAEIVRRSIEGRYFEPANGRPEHPLGLTKLKTKS